MEILQLAALCVAFRRRLDPPHITVGTHEQEAVDQAERHTPPESRLLPDDPAGLGLKTQEVGRRRVELAGVERAAAETAEVAFEGHEARDLGREGVDLLLPQLPSGERRRVAIHLQHVGMFLLGHVQDQVVHEHRGESRRPATLLVPVEPDFLSVGDAQGSQPQAVAEDDAGLAGKERERRRAAGPAERSLARGWVELPELLAGRHVRHRPTGRIQCRSACLDGHDHPSGCYTYAGHASLVHSASSGNGSRTGVLKPQADPHTMLTRARRHPVSLLARPGP